MMNYLTAALSKSGLLKEDLDYHVIRASMVIVFLLFGYQKWFEYEAQVLIPYISNGPLISWMYPVFGIRGEAAGGFPAMTGNIPFLMKDVVLLAVSFYLLRQDVVRAMRSGTTNYLIENLAKILAGLGLLSEEVEYRVLRASMVIIFAFFGYTKWHQYAAELLIPFISNSPFISWLYPAFGLRGATRFLGASDWTMFALLYAGFWDKRFGVLGALGSTGTFLTTLTIIPFIPGGWDPAAGFPAMAGAVPFLMKDIVLLAVSIYLLKQDVVRMALTNREAEMVPEMLSMTGVPASRSA
jgi:uncharacterized membrane protein YkgB